MVRHFYLASLHRLTAFVTVAAHLATTILPVHADAMRSRGAEAQGFGLSILPDMGNVASQPAPGTLRLWPGTGGAIDVDLDELFPGYAGASPVDPATLFGDDGALRGAAQGAAGSLDTAPTLHGEAWRTLTDTQSRSGVDLREDPVLAETRSLIASLDTLVGEFSACTAESGFAPRDLVNTVTTEERCLRVSRPRGRTTLRHDLDVAIDTAQRSLVLPGALHRLEIDFRAGTMRSVSAVEETTWCHDWNDDQWRRCTSTHYPVVTGSLAPLDWDALCGAGADASLELLHTQFRGGTAAHRLVGIETPSCANGLMFRADTAGAACFQEWNGDYDRPIHVDICPAALLALSFAITTILSDSWGPADVLDDVLALQAGGCHPALTTIAGSDGASCVETGGGRICPGDGVHARLAPPPFDPTEASVDRLAMQVEVDLSACAPMVPVAESCTPLRETPSCAYRTTNALDSGAGAPMLFEDVYDCAVSRSIETVAATGAMACPPPVRGIGDDLLTPLHETNDSFAEAAARLSAAQFMAMDTACGDPGDPAADPLQCRVFDGEARRCAVSVFGIVNCCDTPAGVSLAQYIALAFAIRKVDGAVANMGVETPLRGAWELATSPFNDAWSYVGRHFASGVNSITGTTLISPTDVAAQGLVTTVTQNLTNSVAQWTASTFGDVAANALFNVSGGPAFSGGTLLGDAALGPAGLAGSVLGWVMTAYTVYQVAMLIISIVWSCSRDELETAVKRELRSCRAMGSYCARRRLGICLSRRRSFCCFASPLSRIMQEQIRHQTGVSWGSAQNPKCEGLTVAQMQAVDFDAIDLGEWLDILMDSGVIPDGAAITADLLTGSGHSFAGALPAGHTRQNALDRTLGRTDALDIEGIGQAAREGLQGDLAR